MDFYSFSKGSPIPPPLGYDGPMDKNRSNPNEPLADASQALADIIAYHQASKHDYGRFATGPGELDWANQPDPFRRYHGSHLYALLHPMLHPMSHPTAAPGPSYGEVSIEAGLAAQRIDLNSISQLLYQSLALSAWKQANGSRWALRVNPSSGNLHPSEGYLICDAIAGLSAQPGIYHYAPKEHGLEHRAELPTALWQALASAHGPDTLLLALSSIPWREAWKYGQRAFRYCHHDIGHAIGAITVAAAGLGWRVRLQDGWSSDALAALLGLNDPQGDEAELPDCLLAISPVAASQAAATDLTAPLQALHWHGETNRLSPHHRRWPRMDAAFALSHKPATEGIYAREPTAVAAIANEVAGPPLATLVQQRRSAVAMDGRSAITRSSFMHILHKTLPTVGQVPFTALPWSPQVHLLLFVHRVQGLEPGVYLLLRAAGERQYIEDLLRPEFEWQTIEDGPAGLYRLASGDSRQLAQQLSCTQEIAADGCFAVAMISRFRAPLQQYGAWFYPRLYWECGLIGQVLYLEATASGVAATGIGCFFDDPVHAMLGLKGDEYQSLYHFTVGVAVEDTRLSTLPPYPGSGSSSSPV